MRHHLRFNYLSKSLLLLSFVLAASFTFGAIHSKTASAVTGSDFRAGRIIDDAVFYNGGTMSASDIQNFLNSKMPSCDEWGTQGYAGTTRADYARSRGVKVPFTCLNSYYENPTTHANNLTTTDGQKAAIPSGAISAAQIIYNVAQIFSVNPQVLVALLEKEQGLVQDDWPWPIQYRSATGYGCPDGSDCDSQYYGFYNQVYNAARQFRLYRTNPNNYNYIAGQYNNIAYNPNGACGSSSVYIENQATAGLYDYTPYQPNAAALNNLYGSGDACSSYGNRNFWRLFNDWFNSADTIRNGIIMTNISQPDTTPARGQVVSYTVSFKNTMSVSVTFDAIGVVGRQGDPYTGANRDFGWVGPITIASNETKQFTFTSTVSENGMLYAWPALKYYGSYIQYNNWGVAMSAHEPNISLVSPLTSSVQNPVAGQTSTFSATIKNNEDQPINLSAIGIPIRFYDRYNYDTAWTSPSGASIAAGATIALSGDVLLDKPGPFTAWVSGVVANQYTTLSANLNLNVTVPTPKFSLTYIETPNLTPSLGEDVVVKFKLKNNSGVPMTLNSVGVVGRYGSPNSTVNNDLGWVGPVTFANGEEKSFTTFASNISQLKNYYTWVAINYQGSYTQYDAYGFTLTPHSPNLTTPSPITINGGTTPVVGQIVPVTVTIKNNEPKAIRFSAIGIPIRFYGVYNYDAVWQGPGTLAPSGQSGDSITLNGTVTFDKPGPYTVWASILVNGSYLTIGNIVNLNL